MRHKISGFLFLFLGVTLSAQVTFQPNPDNESIDDFLSSDGFTISNSVLTAGDRELQIALLFDGIEEANLEIEQGLYFSTGDVNEDLTNMNESLSVSNSNDDYEDDDLMSIDELAIHDVVIYEFDLTLNGNVNSLDFSYQFGSEEYPDFVGSKFNDVFAVFISGPGFEEPTNIALLPTSDNPVAVNYVNGGVLGVQSDDGIPVDLDQTDLYFNNGHDNDGTGNTNSGTPTVYIEFNGITKAITSQVSGLIPGETYHLKFAISDVADSAYDSGVIFDPIRVSEEFSDIQMIKYGELIIADEDGIPSPGDIIEYTFGIINVGDFTLTNLELIDTYLGDEITIDELPQTSIDPGDYFEVTAEYAITQEDINTGAVYNLASLVGYSSIEGEIEITSTDANPLPETSPFFREDCPDCTVVLIPQYPEISLIKKGKFIGDPNQANVGDQIEYEFIVANNGNVDLFDIEITDLLPNIQLSGESFDLLVGEINSESYTATYSLSENDIDNQYVENQAEVTGFTFLDEEVYDLSDFEFHEENRPTVIEVSNCDLEIHNAITPNNDGINDLFIIEGINCYPDNKVSIFNRWGVAVYQVDAYNNSDVVFDGTSNARATISKNQKLPTGVYYYVLQYTNLEGSREVEKGSLYINRGD
ncbi:MAG: choice-of-anchor L domain-containing protein [Bacteroidota bacterium]